MFYELKSFASDGDLEIYFKNSLVRLIRNDKAQWLFYLGSHPSKGFAFSTTGKDDTKSKSKTSWIDRKEFGTCKIDVRFPNGFFNVKETALLVERRALRQHLKGLSASHTICVVPVEKILLDTVEGLNLEIPPKYSALTAELCNDFFENPHYVNLDEARASIRSGKAFARALSPHFALAPHHKTKDFLILWHDLPVGEMVQKNKIKVSEPLFRQELVDFFTPRGAEVLQAKT